MSCGFEIPTLGSIIIVVNYQLINAITLKANRFWKLCHDASTEDKKIQRKKKENHKKNPQLCGLQYLVHGNSRRRQEIAFCGNFDSKTRIFWFWPRLPQSAHLVTSELPNNQEHNAANTFYTHRCGNGDVKTIDVFVFWL